MAGFVREMVFPIWNAGAASSDTASGPGCSLAAFTAAGNTLAPFMDANGGPILAVTDNSVTCTNDGGKLLLTFAANALASVLDGTVCSVNFVLGANYTDGYFILHKINANTAYLHPKTDTDDTAYLAYAVAVDTCSIYIGGAFKTQTGFQTADVGGSTTNNHYVYIKGNETVTASVVYAKCGERDNNKWTRYIGVDASWVPLTQGNYACIYGDQDAAEPMQDYHLAQITSTTAENMRFENLRFENTGADSGANANEMCFNKGNASLGGHVFKNCYFKKGNYGYGYTTSSGPDALINCVVEDCRVFGIYSSGAVIAGCYVFATGNCTITNTSYAIYNGVGSISNCVVANLVNTTGKEIGYGLRVSFGGIINNNSIYNILSRGIVVTSYGVTIVNNIIHVKTPGTTDAIYGTGFSYIELANITNDTFANSGFITGSGSVSDLAITATDPWVNAAAGDFRLNRTGLALSNVIDQGFVPYCPSSIAGKTSIGAYSVGDMPLVANVVNNDSVMGTTGTFDEAARNTDPGAANVLDSVVSYKICNSTMVPLYHAPDVSEVWNTATFGAYGLTAGTKRASSIPNCSAANIKDDVVIDDVTGTYTGTSPATPTLAIVLSGTTGTATVTAAVGATVNLYRKATTDSAWVLAGTRTGSGTITVTGLSAAMQYVFVAVATDGTLYSLPSIVVVSETDPAATTNEFDEQSFDDADLFLSAFGVAMTYYPRSGGSRAIVGILNPRNISGVPGVPGGNSPFAEIAVKNSPTGTYPGIGTTELDTGGDKIGYSVRDGQTAQARRIGRIIQQDHGMVTLEVV